MPTVTGTSARMERFSYRAGKNMAKAKGERRAAEEASHMGTTPYADLGDRVNDSGLDEGIHNPFPIPD